MTDYTPFAFTLIILIGTAGYLYAFYFARYSAISQKRPEVDLFGGLIRLILWQPNEGVVILRDKQLFFADQSGKGGIRYIFPFIGDELLIRTSVAVRFFTWEDEKILTREFLKVYIKVVVGWKISDLKKHAFDMDPSTHVEAWLKATAESVIRGSISQVSVAQLMSSVALGEVTAKLREELDRKVSAYGIKITNLDMQETRSSEQEADAETKLKQEILDLHKQIELSKETVRLLETDHQQRHQTWETERNDLKKQIETLKEQAAKYLSVAKQEHQRAESLTKQLEEVAVLSDMLKKAETARKEYVEKTKEVNDTERQHRYLKNKEAYQALLQAMSLAEEMPEKVLAWDKATEELENLRKNLEKMSAMDFFSRWTEISRAYDQWAQAMQPEVQWDTVLVALLRHLREEKNRNVSWSFSREQIARLRHFAEQVGLKLLWPDPGSDLVMREHHILQEERVEGVERGRIVRALMPGLQRREEVIVKSGVVLAR